MDNQDIARVFEEIAALLEIKGGQPVQDSSLPECV